MIYSDIKCKWCDNVDWTVKLIVQLIALETTETEQHVCIPCLYDAHQDWKCEQASINTGPHLYLVK